MHLSRYENNMARRPEAKPPECCVRQIPYVNCERCATMEIWHTLSRLLAVDCSSCRLPPSAYSLVPSFLRLPLRPILHPQLLNSAKLPDIVRDQRQPKAQGVRGNQQIIGADG